MNFHSRQNENLFTRKSLRDRLETEIQEISPFLELEGTPDVNTIVLLKSAKNPEIIKRAKVAKKTGLQLSLEILDYGKTLEIKKQHQIWVQVNDTSTSYTLYKYPLSLRKYPVLTFTLKLHGISGTKSTIESAKKLAIFFDQHDKIKIAEITDFLKREVSIYSQSTKNLEAKLNLLLQGYKNLPHPRLLPNGMHEGILCNEDQNGQKWILLKSDLKTMHEMRQSFKNVYEILIQHLEFLEIYSPSVEEFCFYLDDKTQCVIRVGISKIQDDSYFMDEVDLGMKSVTKLDHLKFIPLPCLVPKFFQNLPTEISEILTKFDYFNLKPMAIECKTLDNSMINAKIIHFEILRENSNVIKVIE